jgi:dinuclear metal center YbgI/SA1388 family protein
MLKIRDIIREMEEWAPPAIAWKQDNVGLQVGDPNEDVTGVLAALEVTPEIIQEAVEKNCNLIISHHPLIFRPLLSLTPQTISGKLALSLARNKLHLYTAHTNIDFSRGGVNFVLGQKLGLDTLEFLHRQSGSLKKIVVFVPHAYAETVTGAMTKAGAGVIGEYESCSFQSKGSGTFRPLEGARPFSGEIGKLQYEDEVRIEMVVPEWRTESVVSAMIEVHPYDEVAYDIYPNETTDPNYGAGIIGTLPEPMPVDDFIIHVKNTVHIPFVRWTRGHGDTVSRVAVCGGSGSDLLATALRRKADAYITADIKYHIFHEARGIIHLIDAGHYETEVFIVDAIIEKLKKKFEDSETKFYSARFITNPITYS